MDIEKNEVVVGEEEEIFSMELIATNLNYVLIDELKEPMGIKAKVRYQGKETAAIIYPIEPEIQKNCRGCTVCSPPYEALSQENRARIKFKNPVRAVTPGQSVVFYINNILLRRRNNCMTIIDKLNKFFPLFLYF